MGKRSESEQLRRAREELKARHAEENRALGVFFDVADRRTALEAEMAVLEHAEATAVADLVAVADVATVSKLVGWSVNRVRSAAKLVRDGTVEDGDDDESEDAIHTAAEVTS